MGTEGYSRRGGEGIREEKEKMSQASFWSSSLDYFYILLFSLFSQIHLLGPEPLTPSSPTYLESLKLDRQRHLHPGPRKSLLDNAPERTVTLPVMAFCSSQWLLL